MDRTIVKHIAEQAGYRDLPTVRLAYAGFNKDLFAQLIVQKCMSIAEEYQNRGGNCYVDNKIGEHFGIK